ncbi:MAG: hypothetical protein ACOX3A_03850 [bacterium]
MGGERFNPLNWVGFQQLEWVELRDKFTGNNNYFLFSADAKQLSTLGLVELCLLQ